MLPKTGLVPLLNKTAGKVTFNVPNLASPNVGRGTGAVTYTRASSAYVTDYSGTIVKLPYNFPAYPNLRLSYDTTDGSTRGAEMASGSLTTGSAYEITAQSTSNFTTVGASSNAVGTVFIATGTVTLDANNKVKPATPVWCDWAAGDTSRTPAYVSRGLLSEGSGSNICLQSAALGTSPWAVASGNSGVTNNAAVAPDGTTTASKIYCTTTTSAGHAVRQTVSGGLTASTTYTVSAFVKAGEWSWGYLFLATSGKYANFNFATGAAGTQQSAGITRNPSTYHGNGWWRISFTWTAASTAGDILEIDITSTDTTLGEVGVVNSGAYIWGAQLETGSVATSYMPSAGTSGTRAATSCGYATSGNISDSVGSLYVEFMPNALTSLSRIASGAGGIAPMFISAASKLSFFDGTNTVASSNSINNAALNKALVTWTGTAVNIYLNGTQTSGTFDGSLGLGATLGMGYDIAAVQPVFTGYLKQINIYPTVLAPADAIRITA